ncbi:GNAT family N-acetyltransferase [Shewanella eurypsychrophilus]|uniref:GNAT family N-acetyltransferase n=1 Tax=Shewanella eurypsychrophilus TaxID=2593656 RepID=A0ABX6V2X7_9GAMM|nr:MULTISPECIES: GNAT family N-acetyltransferase [Shewanella]QFU21353.1 GNAT family N-acetyltransferase [Shewanella sp. YLB-09]QPG56643.1 GNAT family N-acetyltransferase [Shewanella eurypsychrophilus]
MAQIREFVEDDFEQVQSIYLQGIKTGNATFEKNVKSWPEWNEAMLKECRIVAERGGKLVGWAAMSSVSNRAVYAGVAEVSIYISSSAKGMGVGTSLLLKLIEQSEIAGFWSLQAGIFPENKASLHIHKKCGFTVLGTKDRLGKMDGVWRDVTLLERRSQVEGIEV